MSAMAHGDRGHSDRSAPNASVDPHDRHRRRGQPGGRRAAAAQQPVIAIAGVLVLLGAVAVAIRPEVAVLIVVGMIYSNTPVVLSQFHGLPLAIAASCR